MSDLLAAANITVHDGFSPEQLEPSPDLSLPGNANLPRGSEAIEYVLNKGLRYTPGPVAGRHRAAGPLGRAWELTAKPRPLAWWLGSWTMRACRLGT